MGREQTQSDAGHSKAHWTAELGKGNLEMGRTLFNEAVAEKELTEGRDGLWYSSSAKREKMETITQNLDISTHKEINGKEADTAAGSISWQEWMSLADASGSG